MSGQESDKGARRRPPRTSGSLAPVRASTIALPEETWDALRHESDATGASQAELIRQALAIRRAVLGLAAAAEAGQSLEQIIEALLKLTGRDSGATPGR